MGRTILRDIRSVTVGTTSVLLLPAQPGRALVFVGAPPVPPAATTQSSTMSGQVPVSTTGGKLSFTVPTGQVGTLTSFSIRTASTTALQQLAVFRGATTIGIWQGTGSTVQTLNIPLLAGDIVQLNTLAAGAAGDIADMTIGVISQGPSARVSLGFGRPAVLDAGLTIYAGQIPLLLPGAAATDDIYAVADAAGRPINVVDLFYA